MKDSLLIKSIVDAIRSGENSDVMSSEILDRVVELLARAGHKITRSALNAPDVTQDS